MILAEPQRTPYDLHFSVFGVPVRVHPLFWLMSLLLGANLKEPTWVLMWVGVSFFSILIHELGHVAAYRYFGTSAEVVLYSFGGLAIARRHAWRGNWPQILISFAGPLAGFIVAAFIYACLYAARIPFAFDVSLPLFEPLNLYLLVWFLLQINVFWGLINLLPIFPLDGGQISRALFEQFNIPDAVHRSLQLSIAASACMVLLGLSSGQPYLAMMFGYLGYQSYTALQQNRGRFNRSPW